MSILIANKREKDIRYITVETDRIKQFDWILNTLRNFYRSPEKVEALIELGNLEWLGPSPYKKNKGDEDIVNCESKIRDKKLSPGKHGASYACDEEDLIKRLERNHVYDQNSYNYSVNCCFLFEGGKWSVLVGAHKEDIKTVDKSILKKETLMQGLEVYKYNPASKYRKMESATFRFWSEVQQKADGENCTYYIFRSNILITVVTPQQEALTEAV